MFMNTTPAQASANRANTLVGFALYREDIRKISPTGQLTSERPILRVEPTRAGNVSAETKRYARSQSDRLECVVFIAEQRWCERGTRWIETVKFECTAKSCRRA